MKINKNHLLAGVIVTGILGGVTVALVDKGISVGYGHALSKLNSIKGLTATAADVKIGFGSTYAETVLTMNNKFSGMVGDQLTGGEDITIVVKHTLDHFSYPFEINHDAAFDAETSKLIADSLNLEGEDGAIMPVPGQLISRHKLDGSFDAIGVIDHIQYGNVLSLDPTRIYFATTKDGSAATLKSSSDELVISSTGNESKIKLESVNYSWNGTLDGCKAVCEGEQQFSIGKLEQYDGRGSLSLLASDVGLSTSSYLSNDKYSFMFSGIAGALENNTVQWSDFALHTSVTDVKRAAVDEFSKELKVVMMPETSEELAAAKLQEMYARLLETGLSMNVDSLKAKSINGDMNASVSILLPEGKMPNLALNPLGLIPVIEGKLDASFPVAEIDKVFGVGSAMSATQTGFALLSDDKKSIKTKIEVAGGQAKINGNQVPL
ncbi:DUF945 family protein [Vibrio crassostreae]|nr:conserved hypothetical protein [Vibrio chagasii]CAK2848145.1 DUF945 family protein [Vibrio crassostreae]